MERRVGRHRSTTLDDPPRCGSRRIAGIRCSRWLDQKQMCLIFGYGAMLDPLGDNEQFTWTQGHITLAHADGDSALEYEEEIIRVVVRVPDELTLDLDDHEVVTIELAHDAWLPVSVEGGELLCKIDGRHGIHRT